MKLDEINSQTVSEVSNKELVSLHRRVHQLVVRIKQTQKVSTLEQKLISVHEIIVKEMERRKFKHQSDFLKKEGTSMSKLDRYLDFVLEDDRFVFGEGVAMIPRSLRLGELLLEKGKKKWIQKAIEKPGALHTALGVPEDEKIPAEKLEVKPGDTPKMKRRKILAKTLKKITRKRTGKGEEEAED